MFSLLVDTFIQFKDFSQILQRLDTPILFKWFRCNVILVMEILNSLIYLRTHLDLQKWNMYWSAWKIFMATIQWYNRYIYYLSIMMDYQNYLYKCHNCKNSIIVVVSNNMDVTDEADKIFWFLQPTKLRLNFAI